jgi:hypothetical protein
VFQTVTTRLYNLNLKFIETLSVVYGVGMTLIVLSRFGALGFKYRFPATCSISGGCSQSNEWESGLRTAARTE